MNDDALGAVNPDEMTEAQLAEYYYANRDDLAGDEVPSRAPERMSIMLSVRFSAAEADVVRGAAARADMSVSAFLRQCVLSASASNIVDLARIRADLEDVRTKTADALRVLTASPDAAS